MIEKIIGSPGTGKTTYLLEFIGRLCKIYDPAKIGAITYTKAGVEEMINRVYKNTNLPKSAIKNMRTVHSHCFRLLNYTKDKIADAHAEHIRAFSEKSPNFRLPTELSLSENDNLDTAEEKILLRNKKIFGIMNILRNMMIPPKEWAKVNKVYGYEAYGMFESWKDFCYENDLIDYTGMLENVLAGGQSPDIDVLLVDEMQDLTKLQLEIIKNWAEKVEHTVGVGDSDQCIYRFAGAQPNVFIDLGLPKKHLNQSYRVPEKVYDYALSVIKHAYREDVEYHPTIVEGKVIKKLKYPDLSLPGTHMILGRCNYNLKRWKKYLMDYNILWENRYRESNLGWNPVITKLFRAMLTYLDIKYGNDITDTQLRNLIEQMRVNDGDGSANLIKGLKSKIKIGEIEFKKVYNVITLMNNNIFSEDLLSFKKPLSKIFKLKGTAGDIIARYKENELNVKPKVTLGTIHSVKGGEADHVWIDATTSRRCYNEFLNNKEFRDDEYRISYVGITRSKNTVGILDPPRGEYINPTL